MSLNKYAIFIIILALTSCSWVEPTKEGSAVAVVTDAVKVEACKKLATTTSTVLDKVGFIDRTESAIIDELTILAKNKAAELGGDTIISKGPVNEGTMSFEIYKCGQ